ncbi:cyclin-dependent kinase 5 activator 2-like [Poecilia latipinna]|uniref:cyclin-dependent kinase 5 activator 2-like n=1 Tax=Poecilia mexicana TaxID=48701 RepID=UPI00072E1AE1|nr:PREDICTED: cyclin-dependent kinase 5 activator 2-like [Poecilia mexicana]XP_014904781.1 PREDICTED: cyclin-dependent kinase 5 activator 2-like [Poecilia latipinna]
MVLEVSIIFYFLFWFWSRPCSVLVEQQRAPQQDSEPPGCCGSAAALCGVAMGTLLSLPPGCRSAAAALKEPAEVPDEDEEKKKRRSVLLQALRCRKRLAALGSRGKAPEGPKVRARAWQEEQMCIRRLVVQASTGELLRCLSDFLRRRCVKLKEFPSNRIVVWLRNVERALLLQGWQHQGFLSPASLVFVYLLCRDAVDEDTASEQELHATFLTCLYLAYCYLGNEISYPMKPFLVESSRDVFWERALEVIERLSADMLRLNAEPRFFTEVFQDLKRHGGAGETQRTAGQGMDDLD